MWVASAVYERTCHVCDEVRYQFSKTLLNFQRGKQLSANRQIMEQMRYEFQPRGDSFFYLERMNDRTNEEYDKKIAELR